MGVDVDQWTTAVIGHGRVPRRATGTSSSAALTPADGLVWYAAYGSNLHADRFRFYRGGGTPPGTTRHYAGFRDPRPPQRTVPLTLSGTVYFAWESTVWGGGIAFYAPTPIPGWPGFTAGRGYLLTTSQFADLVAQEMHRAPGMDLDLERVLSTGSDQLGPGRYETLVYAGDFEERPVLTFTAPWDPAFVEIRRPVERYVGMLAAGLQESHGWSADRIVGYLSGLPGVRGLWAPAQLEAVVRTAVDDGASSL